jgi:hypothetical protein
VSYGPNILSFDLFTQSASYSGQSAVFKSTYFASAVLRPFHCAYQSSARKSIIPIGFGPKIIPKNAARIVVTSIRLALFNQ